MAQVWQLVTNNTTCSFICTKGSKKTNALVGSEKREKSIQLIQFDATFSDAE